MKRNAKILVIISMVLVSISGLTTILAVDGLIEFAKTLVQETGAPEAAEIGELLNGIKPFIIACGVIELVANLAVGAYALWALSKATNKRQLIAPGVLLILFSGILGIIAAVMMFCAKPEDFEEEKAEIVQ